MEKSIKNGREKRNSVRLIQSMPVRVKINSEEYEGIGQNISEGGIFVDTPSLKQGFLLKLQQPKSIVDLEIDFPKTISRFHPKAEIVWIKRPGGLSMKSCGFGMKFVDLPSLEKNRLSSYIQEIMKYKKRTFMFEKIVYLTDTNAEGNVYFARYFDWQGMAREEFIREVIPNCIELFSNIKFITVEATTRFKQEAKLFDEIIIEVSTANIKDVSFELIFSYVNKKTGQLIATGKEVIAFGDFSGRLIPIPEQIRKTAKYFLKEE